MSSSCFPRTPHPHSPSLQGHFLSCTHPPAPLSSLAGRAGSCGTHSDHIICPVLYSFSFLLALSFQMKLFFPFSLATRQQLRRAELTKRKAQTRTVCPHERSGECSGGLAGGAQGFVTTRRPIVVLVWLLPAVHDRCVDSTSNRASLLSEFAPNGGSWGRRVPHSTHTHATHTNAL